MTEPSASVTNWAHALRAKLNVSSAGSSIRRQPVQRPVFESNTAYAVWWGLDHELGRALWAQCVSVGLAIAAGTAAYAAGVWILRVPEARQIRALVAGRLRPS